MGKKLTPPEQLSERLAHFFEGYYLIGAWRDKESLYALTQEQLKQYPRCIYGLFVVLVMDGNLERAGELIRMFDEHHLFRLGMELSYPQTTLKRSIEICKYMKAEHLHIRSILITAGRPFVLNGVYDCTRLAPFLERKRERFIEAMQLVYDDTVCTATYNLCLAEWYYQQDRLQDAGELVGQTINSFDNDQQRRLMFAALYLQTKVLLASGTVKKPGSYIRNIRRFVRKAGEQEFSYNINAAEAYAAMYEGNYELISHWLTSDAPDEISSFNMLDLYGYMIKLRCYIINKKYMAVVALGERLRPLLVAGNRIMDMCEMDLLLAISFFRSKEKELAFAALERAIKIIKRRGYHRLIEDEGSAVLPVLTTYVKEKGESPLLLKLVKNARNMAVWHPLYLRPANKTGLSFSTMELNILKFLAQGKDKKEIAEYYFVSENAIKFHMKKIYKKLEVKSVTQAVWEARVMGLL